MDPDIDESADKVAAMVAAMVATAHASRQLIAVELEEADETGLAWLYRSTII